MVIRKPLVGYNHNFRYKNRVYHVQSEDSGVESPHIYTHIFHEGMIISSAKTDYHDLAKEPDHVAAVRKLMQKQHKGLMKRLRRGGFDEKIIELLGSLEGDAGADETLPEGTAEAVPAEEAAALPVGVDFSAIEVVEDEAAETPATADAPDEADAPAGAAAPAEAEAPAAAEIPAADEVPADEEVPDAIPPDDLDTSRAGDEAILAAAEAVISVVADKRRAATPRAATPRPATIEPERREVESSAAPPPAEAEVADGAQQAEIDAMESTRIEPRAAGDKPLRPMDTVPDLQIPEIQALRPEEQTAAQPPPTPPVQEEREVTQFLNVDKLRQQSRVRRGLPARDAAAETRKAEPAQPNQRISTEVSVLVDAPPAGSGEQEQVKTPSFYSHVYRERTDSEPMIQVRPPTVPKYESKVFRKPLPGAPRLPTPEEALPELNPIKPRRSGVYLVPGGPPQRPPHPDPRIRRQSHPAAAGPRYSSSPQQYTAPSSAAGGKKRKRSTGSYEEIPAHQPEATRRPPTGDISARASSAATQAEPRTPPTPPAKPPPPPKPPPTPPPAAEPVVARPAVIISQPVHVGPKTQRPRPPSATVPPPMPEGSPKPPSVTPMDRSSARVPQPPRAAQPSSVFGSDLISERSLDEVILAYLAEDSENAEE